MKRLVLFILSAFLVIAPVGEEISLNLNQTAVTYAAKSSKKSSSSSKKKKSTKKRNTKKKSSSTKKSITNKSTTNKSATSKKSTSTSNSKTYNYSSSTNYSVINDSTSCYISEYGECYHRSSSCASRKNPVKTTVGEAKKSRRMCSKCW